MTNNMAPKCKCKLFLLTLCPYLFWIGVLLLYFGTVMLNTVIADDQPSTFLLPKLLFLISVAILVERRGGHASILKRPTTVAYEIILTLTACNLALALIWDQVEKAVYITLIPLAVIVEALTAVKLRCETCHGIDDLHYVATTLIAAAILFWVLYSLVTLPFIQRNINNCFIKKPLGVKFWSVVEVRFINKDDHHPVDPTSEQLKAPLDEGKNPLVNPHRFILNVDCD